MAILGSRVGKGLVAFKSSLHGHLSMPDEGRPAAELAATGGMASARELKMAPISAAARRAVVADTPGKTGSQVSEGAMLPAVEPEKN